MHVSSADYICVSRRRMLKPARYRGTVTVCVDKPSDRYPYIQKHRTRLNLPTNDQDPDQSRHAKGKPTGSACNLTTTMTMTSSVRVELARLSGIGA